MDITNPAYAPDEEVYGKKIHPIPTESKKDAVGISDVLYDNIVNTSFSSPIDISALSSLTSTATTRNELYNIYDTMCEDGRIGAVVKTYAEDATEKNDEGKIVWATSTNSDISYLINYYIDSFTDI